MTDPTPEERRVAEEELYQEYGHVGNVHGLLTERILRRRAEKEIAELGRRVKSAAGEWRNLYEQNIMLRASKNEIADELASLKEKLEKAEAAMRKFLEDADKPPPLGISWCCLGCDVARTEQGSDKRFLSTPQTGKVNDDTGKDSKGC